jgi:Transmembrane family 220, helix
VSGFSRTGSRAVRILDLTMAALFAFAAVLQLNDPDPSRWLAIYATASVLSLPVAFRRPVWRSACIAVAVVALAWAAFIVLLGPGASEYGHMFEAWEMKSPAVEEAREASGLLIVAAWMIVLFLRGRRTSLEQA